MEVERVGDGQYHWGKMAPHVSWTHAMLMMSEFCARASMTVLNNHVSFDSDGHLPNGYKYIKYTHIIAAFG